MACKAWGGDRLMSSMTVLRTLSGKALRDAVDDDDPHPPQPQGRRGHTELLLASPDGDREVQVVVDDRQFLVKLLKQLLLSGSLLRHVIERTYPLHGAFDGDGDFDVRLLGASKKS